MVEEEALAEGEGVEHLVEEEPGIVAEEPGTAQLVAVGVEDVVLEDVVLEDVLEPGTEVSELVVVEVVDDFRLVGGFQHVGSL